MRKFVPGGVGGLRFILCLSLGATAAFPGQKLKDLEPVSQVRSGDTIVVGFLGGWEPWDDSRRSVRKVVVRLRGMPRVHAESFSNHNRELALKYVEKAIDTNHNKRIDKHEAAQARVIIFGHSLGGAATVELARELNARKIPVLLTVQVDSVGLRDGKIPPNVRAAANYFQREPLTIRGRSEIRAASPEHTTIIGNFERNYPVWDTEPPNPDTTRTRLIIGGGHMKMEADPTLWAEVESLIRNAMDGRIVERAGAGGGE